MQTKETEANQIPNKQLRYAESSITTIGSFGKIHHHLTAKLIIQSHRNSKSINGKKVRPFLS